MVYAGTTPMMAYPSYLDFLYETNNFWALPKNCQDSLKWKSVDEDVHRKFTQYLIANDLPTHATMHKDLTSFESLGEIVCFRKFTGSSLNICRIQR